MSNTRPECPRCNSTSLTLIDSIKYPPDGRLNTTDARRGIRYAFKCECGLAFTHLSYFEKNGKAPTPDLQMSR